MSQHRSRILSLLVLTMAGPAIAQEVVVPPAAVTEARPGPAVSTLLDSALRDREQRFDATAGLMTSRVGGPGYHTRLPKDQLVHGTKDNADYAHLLLLRGQPEDVARASVILDHLLTLQNTDPASPNVGLWDWFAEEAPSQMAPADQNWADFIGARLVEILVAHEARLAPELAARMRTALGLATRLIVRRNVGPEYTNICTMGAAVCLGAGRVLQDADLVAYGRRRIAAQRAACEANGGVPEYNSPHYTTILLQELERILRVSDDAPARADAEWMHQRIWTLIADQFHPGTGQWSGARSRTYNDQLRSTQALFLWQRTGVAPRGAARMSFAAGPDDLQDLTEVRCPPALVARFQALPSDPYEMTQTWMPATPTTPGAVLHTWFSEGATLGSATQASTWNQQRPLVGYWRAQEGVAILRLRLLKDDKDFASGVVRTAHQGPRLLAVLGLAAGQGDWHPTIDRPADGSFTARDLRLRLSLDAKDARIAGIAAVGWTLTAGDHRLVAHLGEARFDGQLAPWEAGEHEGGVHIDAVLHHGEARTFAPTTVAETMAGLGLELLDLNEVPNTNPVTSTVADGRRTWTWAGVSASVTAPVRVAMP